MYRKSFLKVASLVATVALMLFVPSFAYATTTYSSVKTGTANGVTFYGQASTATNGSYVVGKMAVDANSKVGTGYMHAKATFVCGSTAIRYAQTYSGSSSSGVTASCSYAGSNGSSYYTNGQFRLYNDSIAGYDSWIYATSPGLIYYKSSSSSLTTSLLEEPSSVFSVVYQVTDMGETYGSVLGEESIGVLPDWICAQATNGACGYVKASDYWVPEAVSPEDAALNYSTLCIKTIPVYAAVGNDEVVGYFEMCYGGDGSAESLSW